MGTTPTFGWATPNDTDYVYLGYQAIDTLGDSVDSTLTTISGSTGSGDVPKLALDLVTTATIGTAVSSVTVSNCFSSKYDNYKVIVTGGSASSTPNINVKMGTSAGSYYGVLIYATFNGTVQSGAGNNPNNSFWEYVGNGNTNFISLDFDLINPYAAKYTQIKSNYISTAAAGMYSGFHGVASSFTGFTFAPSAGTFTGGTIRVYGYRNS